MFPVVSHMGSVLRPLDKRQPGLIGLIIFFLFMSKKRGSVEFYINTIFSSFICFSLNVLSLSFPFHFVLFFLLLIL